MPSVVVLSVVTLTNIVHIYKVVHSIIYYKVIKCVYVYIIA
jgi:hypothetical protein